MNINCDFIKRLGISPNCYEEKQGWSLGGPTIESCAQFIFDNRVVVVRVTDEVEVNKINLIDNSIEHGMYTLDSYNEVAKVIWDWIMKHEDV